MCGRHEPCELAFKQNIDLPPTAWDGPHRGTAHISRTFHSKCKEADNNEKVVSSRARGAEACPPRGIPESAKRLIGVSIFQVPGTPLGTLSVLSDSLFQVLGFGDFSCSDLNSRSSQPPDDCSSLILTKPLGPTLWGLQVKKVNGIRSHKTVTWI